MSLNNKYCPICGEENNCMAETAEHGKCWCNQEKFPSGLFELVPAESIRKHCICKKCLDKYQEENMTNLVEE